MGCFGTPTLVRSAGGVAAKGCFASGSSAGLPHAARLRLVDSEASARPAPDAPTRCQSPKSPAMPYPQSRYHPVTMSAGKTGIVHISRYPEIIEAYGFVSGWVRRNEAAAPARQR